jgi:hypothetical protein
MSDFGAAYSPAPWSGFFSAELTASAALTGLLFVAISINLPKIISIPLLTARAAKALSTLVGVLLAASLCLVPGQSRVVLGWELVVVGVIAWVMIAMWQRGASRENPYIGRFQKICFEVLSQTSCVPTIVGGVSLVAGRGGGLYWLVAGMIASLVAALLDAWVLLIEIQR